MRTALNYQFDPADKAAFDAQVARFRDVLGNTPGEAIRRGTIALCRSLQASTKTAPRRRAVNPDPRDRRRKNRLADGQRRFIIRRLDTRTGQPDPLYITAPDLARAKLHPAAQIRRHGLARASWGWAMQQLFSERSGARPGLVQPAGALRVSKRIDTAGGYSEVFIENRLHYISAALAGGRGPAVATAMARATATMRTRIDRELAKAKGR